ncbi:unnamed protein product [Clonostachys byssicola]|uniref:Ent-kaurene synthase n=1 Tax=Clonostachys byssicola TaxID=160290 RepID=A0A9N9U6V4_9HYPO|nr:unnamed protein product [Clonostachys byssicola]
MVASITAKGSSDMHPHHDGRSLPVAEELAAEARLLLKTTSKAYDSIFGVGSMSCSVYDTAWVSLVMKTEDGSSRWLFPESFYYLLSTQASDGSWGGSDSQIDGILSTAASLLSLLRHSSAPLQLSHIDMDILKDRTAKAEVSLHSQLRSWCVASTVHVGFEVIVPALLELLSKENPSLQFSFAERKELERLNATKLSRFKPEYLYTDHKSTIIHSLEAFIGKLDFDKVAHHKAYGSMMGSPSSTSAYLMNASQWDNEAEEYLRHVVQHGDGKANGGVPSAFPSTYFEYSWVLSTLLTSGFSPAELESTELKHMAEVLGHALKDGQGVIGFAPRFMADVDDTAKTLICLKQLGEKVDPGKMIETFESQTHFKTYESERNPSFSANCNALLALLYQEGPQQYSSQVFKMVVYLCDQWWTAMNDIKDKWNISNLYPTLLFVEAIIKLVDLMEQGNFPGFSDKLLQSRAAVCLYQACYRTLLQQSADGSWNGTAEETSYGIIILSHARRLFLFNDFHLQLDTAMDRGSNVLLKLNKRAKRYTAKRLWIEKIGYFSPVLSETYRLAALRSIVAAQTESHLGHSLAEDKSVVPKLSQLWLRTPLFSKVPEWEIRASMIEGTLFRPIVRALRLSVFTRKGVEEDKYFDVIPLAWPTCNNRTRTFAPSCFLFEGMMAALLNYQVDEFIEAIAGVNYADDIPELRRLIDEVINSISDQAASEDKTANGHSKYALNGAFNGSNGQLDVDTAVHSNGHHNGGRNGLPDSIEKIKRQEVLVPLKKFVTRALTHPAILAASPWDRKNMTCELRIYLQTHVTQSEDNVLLKEGRFSEGIMREHFFRWVRTTSADHTSATYTFNFVSCLLSAWNEEGSDCFASTQEKYFGAAMCQHLATMCRMYNDHGSAVRDYDERNLNSIDFPEFCGVAGGPERTIESFTRRKDALFEVAQYERSSLEDAFHRISNHAAGEETPARRERKSRQMDIWWLFYNVTDLFGQIYVLRDIGSRLTI